MKKAAFLLGVLGSVVLGLVASKGLVRRDYAAGVVNKTGEHGTCPTLWVQFDRPPDVVPDGLVACPCAEQARDHEGGKPIHPPRAVVDAAAPSDQLTISYTEFTPPFGGKKVAGLSYALMRGVDRQSFVASPAWSAYSKFALITAAPFLIGAALAVILGFLPSKKGATD